MTIYVQHILHVQTCTIFQSKHLANLVHLVLLKDRILFITSILLKFRLK